MERTIDGSYCRCGKPAEWQEESKKGPTQYYCTPCTMEMQVQMVEAKYDLHPKEHVSPRP